MDSAKDDELAHDRAPAPGARAGRAGQTTTTRWPRSRHEEPGEFAPRFAEVRGDVLLAKGDKAGALREYLAARANGTRRARRLPNCST